MRYAKFFLLGLFLCQCGLTAWFLFRSTDSGTHQAAPNVEARASSELKSNLDRVAVGMALKEVEAIMGPAGGNYSSYSSHGYYIWKTKESWASVFMEDGKVTKTHFRPAPE